MTQYILDTDCFTLLQQLNLNIMQRMRTIEPDNIAITIVTVEEQIRGWLNAIRKHSQSSYPERVIQAYLSLRGAINYISRFNIVDFSPNAYHRFTELRRQKIRIGTQDLRIASIVLTENSILVTRNSRDFSQVPGLVFEDWTISA